MGPAGAGKGTMSDLILKEYDIPHISTGDMLRDNVRNNTELGNLAKSYMDAGNLVPDDVIIAMVEKRLQEDDCQKGYLLDGFPRTLDTLVERMTGRRICPKCGAICHIHNKPSKVEGICDVCGSELTQRKDDTVEQLTVRMDGYEKSTKPVIDFYDKRGIVSYIDASQETAAVFEKVKEALSKLK